MRIGFDARMYGAKATTGIGVYIKQLTDALFAADQDNEYVLFVRSATVPELIAVPPRVKIVVADIPWYGWAEQIKLPRLIAREHCDIVHFPHFNVPLFYRGRYIVTIHDLTPKFFPGPLVRRSLLRRAAYQAVFHFGIKRATAVITISQYTKNLINTYHFTPEPNLHVISPGVDYRFAPVTDQLALQSIQKKYGLTKPYFIYVGVWRDHKNIPGLIKAFEICRGAGNLDCQLVIAGEADERYPEISNSIQQSVARQDIITPGFISDQDLPAMYSGAIGNVLVSFTEGFGLVALEAAACGTPTICSRSAGVMEALGDSALPCDPADPESIANSMQQLLANKALRAMLSQRGLKRSGEFRWERCAKQVLSIYRTS